MKEYIIASIYSASYVSISILVLCTFENHPCTFFRWLIILSDFHQCMMRSSRCFLLACFALVASTRLSTDRYTVSTNDPLQRLIHKRSSPPFFDEETGVLRKFYELQKRSLRPLNPSPAQVMGGLRTKESEALSTLLLAVVESELYACALGTVWDSSFDGSVIVDRLSRLPNAKQVILFRCSVYSHVISGSLAYMREQRFVFATKQY